MTKPSVYVPQTPEELADLLLTLNRAQMIQWCTAICEREVRRNEMLSAGLQSIADTCTAGRGQ